MKKLIQLLCISICIPMLLCFCADNQKYNIDTTAYCFVDPWSYSDLVENSDYIFLGRATDISFDVIDIESNVPVTKDTPKDQRIFCTLYNFSVLTSYKGAPPDSVEYRYTKGLLNYREEEQREILREKKAKDYRLGLPISSNEDVPPDIELGRVYLCFVQAEGDFVFTKFTSYICPIYSSSEKELYHDDRYVTLGKGEIKYIHPFNIRIKGETIEEIIRGFGEDKWNDFYARWEKGEFEPISVE